MCVCQVRVEQAAHHDRHATHDQNFNKVIIFSQQTPAKSFGYLDFVQIILMVLRESTFGYLDFVQIILMVL